MIAARQAPRLDHALLAGAVLLAALAAWPFLPQAAPAPPPAIVAAPPPPLPALPPLARFAAVVDRPLFSPSRRPAGDDAAGLGGGGLSLRYRLLGVAIAGDRRRALVADGAQRRELGVGDGLAGWTVIRIDQDRVLLTSPSGETALALRHAADAPPKPRR